LLGANVKRRSNVTGRWDGSEDIPMKCTICGKPIVLVPSADERAKKYSGKASDYTKLFTTHSECTLAKNKKETLELMREIGSPDHVR